MLADVDGAPIAEPLRATLKLLGKLTREHAIIVDDVKATLATGVTRAQLADAFAVAFCFNVIDRLADTFEFQIPDADGFAAGARMLLKRGYEM